MNHKKWIVGGGINGLIYAFYNREYGIITPHIGGDWKRMQNTIVTHAGPMTKKLLEDVGVPYETFTRKVEYIKGGKVIPEIGFDDQLAVIRKKIGDPNHCPPDDDVAISTGDYFISSYVFDFESLVEGLFKGINVDGDRVVLDQVIRIMDDEIITSKTSYEYTALVSTIPAPIFWNLRKMPRDLEAHPLTMALVDSPPKGLSECDTMYFVDETVRCVRANGPNVSGGPYLYEFPGRLNEQGLKEALNQVVPAEAKVISNWVNEFGCIKTDKQNIPPRNTIFCGRMAAWEHSLKIGDVVRQATFDCDMRFVWNRQAEFTSKFVDIERLDDQKYREEKTREYILHLYPEVGEILNAVNYKVHRGTHEVDEKAVKLEIVDCFKYLLNLMLVWGMSPEELFDLFNEKSDIVEERWRKLQEESR